MDTIKLILVNTPWWVYPLLAYLIWVGIEASKTQIEELNKLYIAPAIFTYLSLDTLFTAFKFDFMTVGIWLLGIAVGVGLGALQIWRLNLRVDSEHKLIEIPGSWSVLIIILLIFVTKYYFSYQLGMDPKLANQTGFEFACLGLSGMFTGTFIGKLLVFLHRMKTSPSVDLKGQENSA